MLSYRHVTLPYYVANDLSLGEFLEQMCFKLSTSHDLIYWSHNLYRSVACPTCHHDAFSHQTHFVHSSSCLRLNVYRLPHSIPGSNGIIYNWHQCKKCQQVTNNLREIQPVVIFVSIAYSSYGALQWCFKLFFCKISWIKILWLYLYTSVYW